MISSSKKISTESIFDTEEENPLSTSIHKIDTFEKLGAAIGKVIEVKFTVKREGEREAQEVSIPVVVKLDTMVMPSDVIDAILTMNEQEISFTSRFKAAIAGRISFIKDFILCSDLIKTQKKTMIKDPTGYYNQLLRRINNSRIYSVLSGNISLAGISSIFVISEEDEAEIQKRIGGKLTNEKTREIVFDNISAMAIVVVDRSWERVTIYIRDINGFSQNSFEDFKSAADKNSGVQIQDILKSFTLGNNPVF